MASRDLKPVGQRVAGEERQARYDQGSRDESREDRGVKDVLPAVGESWRFGEKEAVYVVYAKDLRVRQELMVEPDLDDRATEDIAEGSEPDESDEDSGVRQEGNAWLIDVTKVAVGQCGCGVVGVRQVLRYEPEGRDVLNHRSPAKAIEQTEDYVGE